jgi:hypothetical protein
MQLGWGSCRWRDTYLVIVVGCTSSFDTATADYMMMGGLRHRLKGCVNVNAGLEI